MLSPAAADTQMTETLLCLHHVPNNVTLVYLTARARHDCNAVVRDHDQRPWRQARIQVIERVFTNA